MTDYYIAIVKGSRQEFSAITTHSREDAFKEARQRAQKIGGTVTTFETFKEHSERVPSLGLTSIMGIYVP